MAIINIHSDQQTHTRVHARRTLSNNETCRDPTDLDRISTIDLIKIFPLSSCESLGLWASRAVSLMTAKEKGYAVGGALHLHLFDSAVYSSVLLTRYRFLLIWRSTLLFCSRFGEEWISWCRCFFRVSIWWVIRSTFLPFALQLVIFLLPSAVFSLATHAIYYLIATVVQFDWFLWCKNFLAVEIRSSESLETLKPCWYQASRVGSLNDRLIFARPLVCHFSCLTY